MDQITRDLAARAHERFGQIQEEVIQLCETDEQIMTIYFTFVSSALGAAVGALAATNGVPKDDIDHIELGHAVLEMMQENGKAEGSS
jgi:hypothetical protein